MIITKMFRLFSRTIHVQPVRVKRRKSCKAQLRKLRRKSRMRNFLSFSFYSLEWRNLRKLLFEERTALAQHKFLNERRGFWVILNISVEIMFYSSRLIRRWETSAKKFLASVITLVASVWRMCGLARTLRNPFGWRK